MTLIYGGHEVCTLPPDAVIDQQRSVARERERVEAPAGTFATATSTSPTAGTQQIVWTCTDREELAAVEAFLARQRGRYKAFWLPTYTHDFDVVAPNFPSSFITRPWGYGDLRPYFPFLAYISPHRPNGIQIAYHATVTPIAGGLEQVSTSGEWVWPNVTYADAFGESSGLWREELICLARLVRLAEDTVETQHFSTGAGRIDVTVVDVPYEPIGPI